MDKQLLSKKDKGKEKTIVNDDLVDSPLDVSDENDDVNVSGDELNSPRGSDEDEDDDKPQFPVFNTNDIFDPKFKLGMAFSTKQEMKLAIQSYAINEKRSIKFARNDKRRLVAKCADGECPWILRGCRWLMNQVLGLENWWISTHARQGMMLRMSAQHGLQRNLRKNL